MAFLLCLLFILSILAQKQAFGAKLTISQQHPNGKIQYGITEGSLRPQECGGRCRNRCSKTSFKKPCMSFCQKCCAKCLCVPPGTYGNKQVCPCYNNWKTKRGGPKCP
ncbi:Gibberellin-regulated protein 6 [Striga hermonthica]|uniref:Gibberellin-regulated protein 6 n=1 Tax=Striga hermonthica TaxID=68872 RepID=A0A9N7MXC6_STRHE|nr:Gibberellin-regulated protein 6 [Striga hermonthica]